MVDGRGLEVAARPFPAPRLPVAPGGEKACFGDVSPQPESRRANDFANSPCRGGFTASAKSASVNTSDPVGIEAQLLERTPMVKAKLNFFAKFANPSKPTGFREGGAPSSREKQ
jgi:hypothetical protein